MGEFQGYLESIMSQMMSKDVLQGPMQQIDEKYKEYFVQQADSMSPTEEYQYRRQHEYVRTILDEYEKAEPDCKRVEQLLQDMQECGQPPPEIVKELASAIG